MNRWSVALQFMLLTTSAILIAGTCSPLNADEPCDANVTSDMWASLVSQAAGLSKTEWDQIVGEGAAAMQPENQPLTWLLLILPITEQSLEPAYREEFEFYPNAKIVSSMTPDKEKLEEPVTAVRPEYVSKITCVVEDNVAKGTIEFAAPRAYRGTIHFVCECVDRQWVVKEFSLPVRKASCTLKDGKWKSKLPAPASRAK